MNINLGWGIFIHNMAGDKTSSVVVNGVMIRIIIPLLAGKTANEYAVASKNPNHFQSSWSSTATTYSFAGRDRNSGMLPGAALQLPTLSLGEIATVGCC